MFRSDSMSLVQLYVTTEIVHDAVAQLGELGNVQFRDLNLDVNPFQRSFIGEIRRIDEMARRIAFFSSQINQEKDEVPVRALHDSDPFITTGPRTAQNIDNMEIALMEHELKLTKMSGSYQALGERTRELIEARYVLMEAAVVFEKVEAGQTDIRSSFDNSSTPLLLRDDYESQRSSSPVQFDLEFVGGTIERDRVSSFERVIWRLLRGNIFIHHSNIEEPFVDVVTGEETRKEVFIIFAHGDALLAKVRKVAESMGATIYPIDANVDQRSDSLRDINTHLEDLQVILYNTGATRHTELVKIGESLESWRDVVRKEKMIYETLNYFSFDIRSRMLIAEGWVPTMDIGTIQSALRSVSEESGAMPILHELHTSKVPPTFFRTNRFTDGFQAIMDSYGIAAYQEVNPGLFAITTFPFLFAVMFGDIGHGFIILCAAMYMIRAEKKLATLDLDEMVKPFFEGRYIILMMGLFSLYTGLIYNDMFSNALKIWESGWTFETDVLTTPAVSNGHVYPFGLDPSWHESANGLTFTNSYKMKMSIVLGVIHMTFSLCLQLLNHVKFKRTLDIYTNFIPQMIFLQSIFGYLVVCILYKWSVDWSTRTTQSPSLLNLLIAMFLEPGVVSPQNQLYPGQAAVQVTLLLLAALCIPWLLIAKPFFVWKEHRNQGHEYTELSRHADDGTTSPELFVEDDDQHIGNEDLGDVVLHQVIHAIEFCLNCISHTASYLRLWALSLAHAQLSGILWAKFIQPYLWPVTFLGWIQFAFVGFFWLNATIGGLCIMEGLSAFLHALRLHWVESNSKHFEGGGHAFLPLTFVESDKT